MKAFIKKILNKDQRTALVKGYHGFIHGFSRVDAWIVRKIYPRRILINVKSNLNVTDKLDYPRHDIFLHVESDIEHTIRLHSCKKEPETIKWIEETIKPGDVLFDVGANVGAYSLVAAKFFKGAVKVFAFEPSFLNFVQLNKNIAVNDCAKEITPLQIALSNQKGLIEFQFSSLLTGAALHSLKNVSDLKNSSYQQKVVAYRLDDLIKEFHLPVPNFMKLDVDGGEETILQGAPETLKNKNLRGLLVEVDEGEPTAESIKHLLEQNGFTLVSKHKYSAADDTGAFAKAYNYIFSR